MDFTDSHFIIYTSDVLTELIGIPDESIDCVVTSPPYWALRDYKVDGQLGNESTFDEFIKNMTLVFREVMRVLKPSGTLWINFGVSWAGTSRKSPITQNYKKQKPVKQHKVNAPYPPKSMIHQPWKIAFALQDDGWYIRQEIIWKKTNSTPDSRKDVCSHSHETLILLSKEPRYFFDIYPLMKPGKTYKVEKTVGNRQTIRSNIQGSGFQTNHYYSDLVNPKSIWEIQVTDPEEIIYAFDTIWEFPTTKGEKGHPAAFPLELPRRCILAGTSRAGNCEKCGRPWTREVERIKPDISKTDWNGKYGEGHKTFNAHRAELAAKEQGIVSHVIDKGFSPDCDCDANLTPPIVLDPFSGSGTTGEASLNLGCHYVGIEINQKWAEQSKRRLNKHDKHQLEF